jgi:peptidyl-prolyl cis-trans isomerase SurA
MKKLFIICLFFSTLVFCLWTQAKAAGQALDQIVAVVNEEVITQAELNHAVKLVKLQTAHTQMAMPATDVLQKQVLEQMINKKLQMQLAKQAGIDITDAEVDKAVVHIAKQNNMTTDEFYQRLKQEGMSITDYRSELRQQITLQKVQQHEIINRITITPEEITSFMHSKMWQDNSNKEYHLEDILVPMPDAPSPEQIAAAKQRAQTIVHKLQAGEDFNIIAQSESGGRSALQGGDLGWRKLLEIPSAFADQIILLQPKEIAGPIQTANGFHVIRLTAVRTVAGNQAVPDEKQVHQLLMQRKFEENLQAWLSKLRAQAFISINTKKDGSKIQN